MREEDFLSPSEETLSSVEETQMLTSDPTSSGDFLQQFNASTSFLNLPTSLDVANLHQTGRQSNGRSHSMMGMNTSMAPSTGQSTSSLARFSSADTYGKSPSIAEQHIRSIRLDFFTDPSFATQSHQRPTGGFSDSLLDLMPEQPGSLTSTSNQRNHSSSFFRLSLFNLRRAIFLDPKQTSSIYSYNRHLLTKVQYPVYLTQQTFFQMFYVADSRQWSKFESLLVSPMLLRRFTRAVLPSSDTSSAPVSRKDDLLLFLHGGCFQIRPVPNEQDTYRVEHLHLQLAFVFDAHLLSYRLRLVALADSTSLQQSSYFWSTDDLQTMETFFSDQLFPPLRKSRSIDSLSFQAVQSLNIAVSTFVRMLMFIPPRVLKDLVRIIQLEQV